MAIKKTAEKADPEQKPQKSQQLILKHTEEAALTQMERKPIGLALSGFSAGLDIGFSVLLMTVIIGLFKGTLSDAAVTLFAANMYPVGFIFVVLGRSELFTEHTTLAVLPVLQKLSSIKKLLRLWGIVYLSNIAGGALFAFILVYFADTLHFLQLPALREVSNQLLTDSWKTLLLTGILAGWLMGLLAWLVAAARETISQLFIIWMITTAIAVIGLPHCIVGNIEVLVRLFNGEITFLHYLSFMSAVTLGNIIGGVLFVAVLKYNHTAISGEEKEIDLETMNEVSDQN